MALSIYSKSELQRGLASTFAPAQSTMPGHLQRNAKQAVNMLMSQTRGDHGYSNSGIALAARERAGELRRQIEAEFIQNQKLPGAQSPDFQPEGADILAGLDEFSDFDPEIAGSEAGYRQYASKIMRSDKLDETGKRAKLDELTGLHAITLGHRTKKVAEARDADSQRLYEMSLDTNTDFGSRVSRWIDGFSNMSYGVAAANPMFDDNMQAAYHEMSMGAGGNARASNDWIDTAFNVGGSVTPFMAATTLAAISGGALFHLAAAAGTGTAVTLGSMKAATVGMAGAASLAGARIGGGLMSYAVEGTSAYHNALRQGYDTDQATFVGNFTGIGVALIESALPNAGISKYVSPHLRRFAMTRAGYAASMVGKQLTSALHEGFEEALQVLPQEVAYALMNGLPRDERGNLNLQPIIDEMRESAVAGALGSPTGTVMTAPFNLQRARDGYRLAQAHDDFVQGSNVRGIVFERALNETMTALNTGEVDAAGANAYMGERLAYNMERMKLVTPEAAEMLIQGAETITDPTVDDPTIFIVKLRNGQSVVVRRVANDSVDNQDEATRLTDERVARYDKFDDGPKTITLGDKDYQVDGQMVYHGEHAESLALVHEILGHHMIESVLSRDNREEVYRLSEAVEMPGNELTPQSDRRVESMPIFLEERTAERLTGHGTRQMMGDLAAGARTMVPFLSPSPKAEARMAAVRIERESQNKRPGTLREQADAINQQPDLNEPDEIDTTEPADMQTENELDDWINNGFQDAVTEDMVGGLSDKEASELADEAIREAYDEDMVDGLSDEEAAELAEAGLGDYETPTGDFYDRPKRKGKKPKGPPSYGGHSRFKTNYASGDPLTEAARDVKAGWSGVLTDPRIDLVDPSRDGVPPFWSGQVVRMRDGRIELNTTALKRLWSDRFGLYPTANDSLAAGVDRWLFRDNDGQYYTNIHIDGVQYKIPAEREGDTVWVPRTMNQLANLYARVAMNHYDMTPKPSILRDIKRMAKLYRKNKTSYSPVRDFNNVLIGKDVSPGSDSIGLQNLKTADGQTVLARAYTAMTKLLPAKGVVQATGDYGGLQKAVAHELFYALEEAFVGQAKDGVNTTLKSNLERLFRIVRDASGKEDIAPRTIYMTPPSAAELAKAGISPKSPHYKLFTQMLSGSDIGGLYAFTVNHILHKLATRQYDARFELDTFHEMPAFETIMQRAREPKHNTIQAAKPEEAARMIGERLAPEPQRVNWKAREEFLAEMDRLDQQLWESGSSVNQNFVQLPKLVDNQTLVRKDLMIPADLRKRVDETMAELERLRPHREAERKQARAAEEGGRLDNDEANTDSALDESLDVLQYENAPKMLDPEMYEQLRVLIADSIAEEFGATAMGGVKLKRIISGGQTGGDMGGLLGARQSGLETGGTAPLGYKTERGQDASLKKYGLTEDNSTDYTGRTKKNVDNADATVAFLWGDSVGTSKTIGYAQSGKWQHGKPVTTLNGYRPILVIQTRDKAMAAKQLREFLIKTGARTLNVAGHRESSQPGIQDFVSETIQASLVKQTKAKLDADMAMRATDDTIETMSKLFGGEDWMAAWEAAVAEGNRFKSERDVTESAIRSMSWKRSTNQFDIARHAIESALGDIASHAAQRVLHASRLGFKYRPMTRPSSPWGIYKPGMDEINRDPYASGLNAIEDGQFVNIKYQTESGPTPLAVNFIRADNPAGRSGQEVEGLKGERDALGQMRQPEFLATGTAKSAFRFNPRFTGMSRVVDQGVDEKGKKLPEKVFNDYRGSDIWTYFYEVFGDIVPSRKSGFADDSDTARMDDNLAFQKGYDKIGQGFSIGGSLRNASAETLADIAYRKFESMLTDDYLAGEKKRAWANINIGSEALKARDVMQGVVENALLNALEETVQLYAQTNQSTKTKADLTAWGNQNPESSPMADHVQGLRVKAAESTLAVFREPGESAKPAAKATIDESFKESVRKLSEFLGPYENAPSVQPSGVVDFVVLQQGKKILKRAIADLTKQQVTSLWSDNYDASKLESKIDRVMAKVALLTDSQFRWLIDELANGSVLSELEEGHRNFMEVINYIQTGKYRVKRQHERSSRRYTPEPIVEVGDSYGDEAYNDGESVLDALHPRRLGDPGVLGVGPAVRPASAKELAAGTRIVPGAKGMTSQYDPSYNLDAMRAQADFFGNTLNPFSEGEATEWKKKYERYQRNSPNAFFQTRRVRMTDANGNRFNPLDAKDSEMAWRGFVGGRQEKQAEVMFHGMYLDIMMAKALDTRPETLYDKAIYGLNKVFGNIPGVRTLFKNDEKPRWEYGLKLYVNRKQYKGAAKLEERLVNRRDALASKPDLTQVERKRLELLDRTIDALELSYAMENATAGDGTIAGKMLEVVEQAKKFSDMKWEYAKASGLTEAVEVEKLKHYTAHFWADDPEPAELAGKEVGEDRYTHRRFGWMTDRLKDRRYKRGGIIQGILQGSTLASESFTRDFVAASSQLTDAATDFLFYNEARRTGMFSDLPVVGYKRLNHPFLAARKLYAPAVLADRMNNAMRNSKFRESDAFNTFMDVNSVLKMGKLMGTLFHQIAIGRSFVGAIPKMLYKPSSYSKAFNYGYDAMMTLDPRVMLLIRQGLTPFKVSDWDQTSAHRLTQRVGFLSEGGALSRKAGGAVDYAANATTSYQNYLFGMYNTTAKITAGLLEYEHALKKNQQALAEGNITEEQIAREIATRINQDFGGLNDMMEGYSPEVQDAYRAIFLGPDWTRSNVGFALAPLQIFSKDPEKRYAGKQAAKNWGQIGLRFGLPTLLANLIMAALDDETALERLEKANRHGLDKALSADISPLLHMVGYGTGNDYYLSTFGHLADPVKMIEHPGRWFLHKMSPALMAVSQAITGMDNVGRVFTDVDEVLGKGVASWDSRNAPGAVDPGQIPSWAASQATINAPPLVQQVMAYTTGQAGALVAMGRMVGMDIVEKRIPLDKAEDMANN